MCSFRVVRYPLTQTKLQRGDIAEVYDRYRGWLRVRITAINDAAHQDCRIIEAVSLSGNYTLSRVVGPIADSMYFIRRGHTTQQHAA